MSEREKVVEIIADVRGRVHRLSNDEVRAIMRDLTAAGYAIVGPEERVLLERIRAGTHVCVPKEPTEAMHDAARDWSHKKYGKPIGLDASEGCYGCMIAAAQEETQS